MKWICRPLDTPLALSSIPFTKEKAIADDENMAVFTSFLKERQEVQLYVEHEVKICERTKKTVKRKRKGTNKKTYRRIVSLIDVAVFFIMSCGGYQREVDSSVLLRESKYSIHSAYLLALSLRELIENQKQTHVELSDDDDGSRRSPCVSMQKWIEEIYDTMKLNK